MSESIDNLIKQQDPRVFYLLRKVPLHLVAVERAYNYQLELEFNLYCRKKENPKTVWGGICDYLKFARGWNDTIRPRSSWDEPTCSTSIQTTSYTWVFYGNDLAKLSSIVDDGFHDWRLVRKWGILGRGIYVSPTVEGALYRCDISPGEKIKMLACQVSLGKEYTGPFNIGMDCHPDYDSHTCHNLEEEPTEHVIFDPCQLLPMYILTFELKEPREISS